MPKGQRCPPPQVGSYEPPVSRNAGGPFFIVKEELNAET
jgi:hypothetical protein